MDMEIENYLRSLGLTWITIAEAMSDEYVEVTTQLIRENPQITKEEFLAKTGIEEFVY